MLFLTYKKKKNGFFFKDALWGGYPPELAWWTRGVDQGWVPTRAGLVDGGSGGARASVPGGVGGRDTGPRDGANFATYVVFLLFLQKEEKWRFLKDVLWGGGGGTHRSWPGGRGGRPRALVAGEGWGGRRSDGRRGLGSKEEQVQGRVREGLAWRSGGVQGLRLRG